MPQDQRNDIERRLGYLLDAIDNQDYQRVVSEVDKHLKRVDNKKRGGKGKPKSQSAVVKSLSGLEDTEDIFVQNIVALKAVSLLRLNKRTEAWELMGKLEKMNISNDLVLKSIRFFLRDERAYNKCASFYQKAVSLDSRNENLLLKLFFEYAIIGDYKNQATIAQTLFKVSPNRNPYFFWGVMATVMQGHDNAKLAKTLFFPMAEKMCDKILLSGGVSEPNEVLLYIDILELQGKWPYLEEKLKNDKFLISLIPNYIQEKLGTCLYKTSKWDEGVDLYKNLILTSEFENFQSHKELIDCVINSTDKSEAIQNYTQWIRDQIKNQPFKREPLLALIHFCSKEESYSGKVFENIQEYLAKFGNKLCCVSDLEAYVQLVSGEEWGAFLDKEIISCRQDFAECYDKLVVGDSDSQLQKRCTSVCTKLVTLVILSRRQKSVTSEEESILQNVSSLLEIYDRTRTCFVDDNVPKTDYTPSDLCLLLANEFLLDLFKDKEDTNDERFAFVYQALANVNALQQRVGNCTQNFHIGLQKIKLCTLLGAVQPIVTQCVDLSVRNLMFDSIGHIVLEPALKFGSPCFDDLVVSGVAFHNQSSKEAQEVIVTAYQCGSFSRVKEVVDISATIKYSLDAHCCLMDALLTRMLVITVGPPFTDDVAFMTPKCLWGRYGSAVKSTTPAWTLGRTIGTPNTSADSIPASLIEVVSGTIVVSDWFTEKLGLGDDDGELCSKLVFNRDVTRGQLCTDPIDTPHPDEEFAQRLNSSFTTSLVIFHVSLVKAVLIPTEAARNADSLAGIEPPDITSERLLKVIAKIESVRNSIAASHPLQNFSRHPSVLDTLKRAVSMATALVSMVTAGSSSSSELDVLNICEQMVSCVAAVSRGVSVPSTTRPTSSTLTCLQSVVAAVTCFSYSTLILSVLGYALEALTKLGKKSRPAFLTPELIGSYNSVQKAIETACDHINSLCVSNADLSNSITANPVESNGSPSNLTIALLEKAIPAFSQEQYDETVQQVRKSWAMQFDHLVQRSKLITRVMPTLKG